MSYESNYCSLERFADIDFEKTTKLARMLSPTINES